MNDDEYEKAQSLTIVVGALAFFGVFMIIAVLAAPYLDQFFRWADGR